jgi:hypothetical protein
VSRNFSTFYHRCSILPFFYFPGYRQLASKGLSSSMAMTNLEKRTEKVGLYRHGHMLVQKQNQKSKRRYHVSTPCKGAAGRHARRHDSLTYHTIPHVILTYVFFGAQFLCPPSDVVIPQACLCLHREGRPRSSAVSIPRWGGGPS